MSEPCIFCHIIQGKTACKKVFENEDMLAFHDLYPAAAVHVLLVPKQHIISLLETDVENALLLGKLLVQAPRIAKKLGLKDGFRTVINTGKAAGQTVFHLHIHVLGGEGLKPHGSTSA